MPRRVPRHGFRLVVEAEIILRGRARARGHRCGTRTLAGLVHGVFGMARIHAVARVGRKPVRRRALGNRKRTRSALAALGSDAVRERWLVAEAAERTWNGRGHAAPRKRRVRRGLRVLLGLRRRGDLGGGNARQRDARVRLARRRRAARLERQFEGFAHVGLAGSAQSPVGEQHDLDGTPVVVGIVRRSARLAHHPRAIRPIAFRMGRILGRQPHARVVGVHPRGARVEQAQLRGGLERLAACAHRERHRHRVALVARDALDGGARRVAHGHALELPSGRIQLRAAFLGHGKPHLVGQLGRGGHPAVGQLVNGGRAKRGVIVGGGDMGRALRRLRAHIKRHVEGGRKPLVRSARRVGVPPCERKRALVHAHVKTGLDGCRKRHRSIGLGDFRALEGRCVNRQPVGGVAFGGLERRARELDGRLRRERIVVRHAVRLVVGEQVARRERQLARRALGKRIRRGERGQRRRRQLHAGVLDARHQVGLGRGRNLVAGGRAALVGVGTVGVALAHRRVVGARLRAIGRLEVGLHRLGGIPTILGVIKPQALARGEEVAREHGAPGALARADGRCGPGRHEARGEPGARGREQAAACLGAVLVRPTSPVIGIGEAEGQPVDALRLAIHHAEGDGVGIAPACRVARAALGLQPRGRR